MLMRRLFDTELIVCYKVSDGSVSRLAKPGTHKEDERFNGLRRTFSSFVFL